MSTALKRTRADGLALLAAWGRRGSSADAVAVLKAGVAGGDAVFCTQASTLSNTGPLHAWWTGTLHVMVLAEHTSADGLALLAAGGAGARDAGEAVQVAAVVRGAADLAGAAAGGGSSADAVNVNEVSLADGCLCKRNTVKFFLYICICISAMNQLSTLLMIMLIRIHMLHVLGRV